MKVMPEILINDEKLSRCCLENISLHSQTKKTKTIGEVFQCLSCGKEMELVEESDYLCWQFKM